jgi:acyl dehydratase
MTDLAAIEAGYQFSTRPLLLDHETVSAYVNAVDEPFVGYTEPGAVVPPLAALALAMRGLTDLLAQHPGVLHASQHVTSLRPIIVGSTVTSSLVVRNRSERRGFAALTLDVRIANAGALAVEGSMLLMVPLARGGTTNA